MALRGFDDCIQEGFTYEACLCVTVGILSPENTTQTPRPIPALSLIPRQKPLCVEELWSFHNGGNAAMLAKCSLTLPLTVGMWQSMPSHTHTHAGMHTYVYACTCSLMHNIQPYMWPSMWGILTYPDMLAYSLTDYMRHTFLPPSQICRTPVSQQLHGNVLFLSSLYLSMLWPISFFSITVHTQGPGSQERSGHREQLHEDSWLWTGQGRPQHRLLQKDNQCESSLCIPHIVGGCAIRERSDSVFVVRLVHNAVSFFF